jgi:hypothetical protein
MRKLEKYNAKRENRSRRRYILSCDRDGFFFLLTSDEYVSRYFQRVSLATCIIISVSLRHHGCRYIFFRKMISNFNHKNAGFGIQNPNSRIYGFKRPNFEFNIADSCVLININLKLNPDFEFQEFGFSNSDKSEMFSSLIGTLVRQDENM